MTIKKFKQVIDSLVNQFGPLGAYEYQLKVLALSMIKQKEVKS